MDIDELIKELGPKPPFKPGWFFNEIGNSIEVIFTDVPYYVEWVNNELDILRSIKTNEIVGCVIHNVEGNII